MASLKKHGVEIGRIQFLTFAKVIMSDSAVLKNWGNGWKLAGRVKPEFTPQQAFARAEARQQEFLQQRPAYAAYRREVFAIAGSNINTRARLVMTVEAMPHDSDGVWSECCDGFGKSVQASHDECANLCKLFIAARDEEKRMKRAGLKVKEVAS